LIIGDAMRITEPSAGMVSGFIQVVLTLSDLQ